jgi:integrase/recombinase XerC
MVDQFLAWLRTAETHRPLAPGTIRDYTRQIAAFAQWLTDTLGVAWQPDAVSAERMASYLQYLRGTRAPATQMKAVAALKAFGTWLMETDQLRTNPALRIRARTAPPPPPRTLDPRVMQRLIEAAHQTGVLRDAVIIELLAASGMRASEVAGIQCEHLERGERTLWVRVVGTGKKIRRIPLPAHVGQLIDQYLATRSGPTGPLPTSGPLLVGQRGGITRATITDTVARVAQRAVLTPAERAQVTPHAFRHTVATMLVRRRDLVTAADILGHTNINIIRRYATVSSQDLEAAIQDLVTQRADP